MTDPKHISSESAVAPEELKGSDDAQEVSADTAKPLKSPPPAPQASVGRKTPGAKDVVPFQWKLVGKSHGVELTLFKATERDEVEAQLRRVNMEGYYTNLRVLEIDTKVEPAPGESSKPNEQAGKRAQAKTTAKAAKTTGATPKPAKPKTTARASTALQPGGRPGRTKTARTARPRGQPSPKRRRGVDRPKRRTAGAKSTRKRGAKKK